MSYITFSEFKSKVKAIVFPDREAENLIETHNSYIIDALINLQTYVPCLQDNNVDFFSKGDMQEWCGLDFCRIQRGQIQAVYVFQPNTVCNRYFYIPKSTSFIDQWMSRQKCATCGDSTTPDISRKPDCDELVAGDLACYGDYTQVTESDCKFRGSNRFYAVGPGEKLMVAPRFPCGYTLAVHWIGIKRKYGNNDPIPDDDELIITVAKYVQGQIAAFLDKDQPLYVSIMHPMTGEFTTARANMIHRCTRERRIQSRHQTLHNFDVLQPFYYDPITTKSDEPQVFGIIGDYGVNNSDRDAVATLVDGWNPDFIVSLGDNWYEALTTQESFYNAQGSIYRDYQALDKFYAIIGNHDRNPTGHLPIELDYFNRSLAYFTTRIGDVGLFGFDSGYDGSQVLQQADGVTEDSKQGIWLKEAIAKSTARYNLVLMHHPMFTSFQTNDTAPTLSGDGYLAYKDLRWMTKLRNVSAFLNGHIHGYERIHRGGATLLTNGAGGQTLAAFGTPEAGSQIRYSAQRGAIKATATAKSLTLQFINVASSVIDTVTLPPLY